MRMLTFAKRNTKEKMSNVLSLGSISISRLGREVSEEQPERKEVKEAQTGHRNTTVFHKVWKRKRN